MPLVTLKGTWVAPDLTPRTGRIVATLVEEIREVAVITGRSSANLVNGALPTSGPTVLAVTAPLSGSATYLIRECLNGVEEDTYRIAISAEDAPGGVDLSARPFLR